MRKIEVLVVGTCVYLCFRNSCFSWFSQDNTPWLVENEQPLFRRRFHSNSSSCFSYYETTPSFVPTCKLWLETRRLNIKKHRNSLRTGKVLSIPITADALRWLDWIFFGGYLPSLSINYAAMSKDMEKRFPQLYYIKMKISYDLGYIAIGVAMAT